MISAETILKPNMEYYIDNGIQQFEPRVVVKNVNIDIEEEKNQYSIELTMAIPALNIDNKTYDAILGLPGFDFITTSSTY